MRKLGILKSGLLAAWFTAGTLAAWSADSPSLDPAAKPAPSVTAKERTGRVVVPERPTAIDASPTAVLRPNRPERP